MDFHTFQVLFYVSVFILEVYKMIDHLRQKKRLAEILDKISKSDDKNNLLEK
jgi:hypothetical protein